MTDLLCWCQQGKFWWLNLAPARERGASAWNRRLECERGRYLKLDRFSMSQILWLYRKAISTENFDDLTWHRHVSCPGVGAAAWNSAWNASMCRSGNSPRQQWHGSANGSAKLWFLDVCVLHRERGHRLGITVWNANAEDNLLDLTAAID
jgi:hypothetical protein